MPMHRVQAGDRLSTIAALHGLEVRDIVAANPHKPRLDLPSGVQVFRTLAEGEELTLPGTLGYPTAPWPQPGTAYQAPGQYQPGAGATATPSGAPSGGPGAYMNPAAPAGSSGSGGGSGSPGTYTGSGGSGGTSSSGGSSGSGSSGGSSGGTSSGSSTSTSGSGGPSLNNGFPMNQPAPSSSSSGSGQASQSASSPYGQASNEASSSDGQATPTTGADTPAPNDPLPAGASCPGASGYSSDAGACVYPQPYCDPTGIITCKQGIPNAPPTCTTGTWDATKKACVTPAETPATAVEQKTNYTPWIIGGVVVLAVGGIVVAALMTTPAKSDAAPASP